MTREVIELTEFEIAPILYEFATEDCDYDEYFDEDGVTIGNPIWEEFIFISNEVTYTDMEKGYKELDVIVKRVSDGIFFKGGYLESHYAENRYNTKLVEVFPKDKIITIYE